MPKKVSIVTGPIVGLRSSWFLQDTIRFASSLGEKIVSFNLFEEILTQAGLQPRNAYDEINYIGEILDGYSYQFEDMRQKAYLSIARKIDRLGRDVSAVIRTPASIEWRGYNVVLKDHRIISEVIRPDIIITLIDAEWKIKKRLQGNYGKHVLKVVAHQNDLTISKILEWQASEVSISEDWAEWSSHVTRKKVRHLVLGIETPSHKNRKRYIRDVDGLAKLVTQKNVPIFYVSYSMTVATEKVRKKINDTIWKLRAYGVVIDPASIELGTNVTQKDQSVVFAYTVCRDLRWDVQKVDMVIAIHPYSDAPPFSTGMMDELGHAKAFQKERYLILPIGGGSPFTAGNYIPVNHLFKSEREFFLFVETKRQPILQPRFKKYQRAFEVQQSD